MIFSPPEKIEIVYSNKNRPQTDWQGRVLYWSKKIDATGVWQTKINNYFASFLYVLLGLVVLHGWARFLLAWWENGCQLSLDFILQSSLFVFWVSWLALSCLIFLFRSQTGRQPVVNFYQANVLNKLPRQREEKMIDVSRSFNSETIALIERAWRIAKDYKQPEVNARSLLFSILESRRLLGVLARLGVSREDILTRLKSVILNTNPTVGEPRVSQTFYSIIFYSYISASQRRLNWVGVAQILEGIISLDEEVQDLFNDLSINPEQLRQVINWLMINDQFYETYSRQRRLSRYKPKNSMNKSMTAVATPYLDRFGYDLTLAARYGNLELCVGRQPEIEEIFRVIEAGTNSVVLVGLPGVGKTTIIEGIAQLMVTEDVPAVLHDKRMVSLSLPRLVAGAKTPGVLEERLLRIHQEMLRAGNVILVIENIHDIYGINTQGGEGLDLSEVVADLIADERFLVVTTSNPYEYRHSIAGKALGAKLQKIEINETDKQQTMAVLIAKVNYYEYKYKVFFSLGALNKAIDLANRFMHDFHLPEKAIKILEEVAVYVLKHKGEKSLITSEDVAQLVSTKVNIPLTKISQDESTKLLNLEEEIHQYIINQAEAVRAVASALRRARTELRDEKRPIVNLLFLGPTGVGKTELAKTVALTYFGSSDSMIRLDMSEYQSKESIGRLLGTEQNPKGGLLTEGVKQNPFAVLLLDEIEKAHSDILNIFLQVMDDGRLTDWSGQVIDFTNTIIIATSNAGSQFIQDQLRAGTNVAVIKEMLLVEKLKEVFRPEFLNRFDNIVVFTPLSQEHISQIAKLMIIKSQKRLQQKGIHLEVTDGAVSELAKAGFDPLFGARPMRRVIQEQIDDALAKYLLTGQINRRDVVIFDIGGKITIRKAKQYI